MTLTEFFATLKREAARGKWYITRLTPADTDDMLRVCYEDKICCPVTFVAAVSGGPLCKIDDFPIAAGWLGLPRTDANAIAKAADGRVGEESQELSLLADSLKDVQILPYAPPVFSAMKPPKP